MKTVEEFLLKFILVCEKSKKLAQNTLEGYKVNVNHINRYIGNVYLNEITADTLDDMFFALSDEGLSGTSCLYIYRTLHSAFEMGVKRREIEYNYCDMIEPPRKNKFKAKFIKPEDGKALFRYLNNYDVRYSLPILLGLFLGLRRGEVLGLMWSDVDFEKRVLHIQRTATPKNGGFVFSDCKTEKSNRYLMIPEFLTGKFSEWREIQKNFNPNALYIFEQESGKIFSATVLNKKYKTALKSCGIDTATRFHDLRHTFASYLVNDNVPISVVSQMLGHSKVSTTLDIYTHADIKQQSIALETLEKFTAEK